MEAQKFDELTRMLHDITTGDPAFPADSFTDLPGFSTEQKLVMKKEFGKKTEISVPYNYFESDYF
ncbi:MAG TPA: hypothetical protein VJH04_04150 [archaeon]|nr:hypothetical protein [archaeon]